MSSSSARFRYRTPSGDEVEIASVDQLSRRIASGEIREDTPLYDAGTGQWTEAGQAPVFRFIVEELDTDGEDGGRGDASSSHGTEPPKPPEGSGPEGEVGEEVRDEAGESGDLPLIPDPFGPDAERAPPAGRPPSPPPSAPPPSTPPFPSSEVDDSSEDEEFGPIMFGDPPPSRDPGTTPPPSSGPITRRSPMEEAMGEGGAGSGARDGDNREGESTPPRGFGPSRAPREAAPVDGLESELAGGRGSSGDSEASSDDDSEPGPIRSRPPPGSGGRSRGRVRRRQGIEVPIPLLLVSAVVLLALGAAGWWWLGGTGASVGDEGRQATGGSETHAEVEEAGPERPFPSDVNGLLAGLMENELDRMTDSVRVAVGVPSTPPSEWLSGRYLSSASEHGDVAGFWMGYGDFMEVLMDSDSTLYVAAARRILDADPDDPASDEIAERTAQLPPNLDVDALLRQVEERYARVADERRDRLAQLRETALAAERLHEFLETNEARIEYSPVMGGGVSRDPILEAVPDAPELRRELERHLDEVFRSLDRSRQGGAPSPAGLRVELFERFSRPI
ncbi:MAG: hypothetical protein EA352_04500 [Gemmatimonadales bacterium]|nr:MAG: hypothetical protein EA352_04500 [Gemmatimonadales bacterium]